MSGEKINDYIVMNNQERNEFEAYILKRNKEYGELISESD